MVKAEASARVPGLQVVSTIAVVKNYVSVNKLIRYERSFFIRVLQDKIR
jgi:hypothetical protein